MEALVRVLDVLLVCFACQDRSSSIYHWDNYYWKRVERQRIGWLRRLNVYWLAVSLQSLKSSFFAQPQLCTQMKSAVWSLKYFSCSYCKFIMLRFKSSQWCTMAPLIENYLESKRGHMKVCQWFFYLEDFTYVKNKWLTHINASSKSNICVNLRMYLMNN